MKTKSVAPDAKHLRFRKCLENAIREGGKDLSAEELLAITAHFLGQLIALQDQRKYTSKTIMQLVTENIAVGNREVVDGLLGETGGNA